MNNKKINKLIVKYLSNSISKKKWNKLSDWFRMSENNQAFIEYLEINYAIDHIMLEFNTKKTKESVIKKIRKEKRSTYVKSVFKYAAVVALFVSVGYLYMNKDIIDPNEISANELLIPKDEAITIKLDDGTIKVININEDSTLKDENGNTFGLQNESELSYLKHTGIENLVYNTLNIPYGKKFDLVLSDGTRVYLNSGTTIRYPIKFIEGLSRDVFLEGEAYFDVEQDKKHPFIVHTDEMNIRVLGTKFNVSHYLDDNTASTVLVEGSVELFSDQDGDETIETNTTLLKPGFKAEWNKSNNDVSLENVDTRIYTAWIDGKLIFRNSTFRHIRKTLARHYNVVIKNSNTELDVQLFDATFDIETIDEIIETFNKSYAIKYKIINNEVLIY